MTTAGWTALAITILGAVGYAAASILQAIGASRSTGTVRTLGHPLYLLGLVCDILAWAGSMVALQQLAVYLVESVLASSLAITVVAARLFLKSHLRRRDVIAVAVTVAALAALAMSAGPQGAVEMTDTLRIGFCTAAGSLVILGWTATRADAAPGVIAGIAGLCVGGAALIGRSLALPPEAMAHLGTAALAIVREPLVAALLVFAATGMILYAEALRRGQVGPVTAVYWTGEVVAPSAVALLILGDNVRPGWTLAAAAAGLTVIGAAVVLATAPATTDTALPTALPGATRAALPAAERPVLIKLAIPISRHRGEIVIWWGGPTIWRPPPRPQQTPVQPRQPRPALTWHPPQPATVVPAPAAPTDRDALSRPAPVSRDAFAGTAREALTRPASASRDAFAEAARDALSRPTSASRDAFATTARVALSPPAPAARVAQAPAAASVSGTGAAERGKAAGSAANGADTVGAAVRAASAASPGPAASAAVREPVGGAVGRGPAVGGITVPPAAGDFGGRGRGPAGNDGIGQILSGGGVVGRETEVPASGSINVAADGASGQPRPGV